MFELEVGAETGVEVSRDKLYLEVQLAVLRLRLGEQHFDRVHSSLAKELSTKSVQHQREELVQEEVQEKQVKQGNLDLAVEPD